MCAMKGTGDICTDDIGTGNAAYFRYAEAFPKMRCYHDKAGCSAVRHFKLLDIVHGYFIQQLSLSG